MESDFAPAGSVLIAVTTLLFGGMVLLFAALARQGKPERNFATADRQDLRSIVWASEEAWQASHRANAPWLFAAAGVLVLGSAMMFGSIMLRGAAEAVTFVIGTLCVTLICTLVCCTGAGIAGRAAAKRAHRRKIAESD